MKTTNANRICEKVKENLKERICEKDSEQNFGLLDGLRWQQDRAEAERDDHEQWHNEVVLKVAAEAHELQPHHRVLVVVPARVLPVESGALRGERRRVALPGEKDLAERVQVHVDAFDREGVALFRVRSRRGPQVHRVVQAHPVDRHAVLERDVQRAVLVVEREVPFSWNALVVKWHFASNPKTSYSKADPHLNYELHCTQYIYTHTHTS